MLVLLSLACSPPSVNLRYPYVGSHAINDLVNISHIGAMMICFLFHDNLTFFFGFLSPFFLFLRRIALLTVTLPSSAGEAGAMAAAEGLTAGGDGGGPVSLGDG